MSRYIEIKTFCHVKRALPPVDLMSDEWYDRTVSGETEPDEICIEIEAEYDRLTKEAQLGLLLIEGRIVTETELPEHELEAVRQAIDEYVLFA